MPLCYEGEGSKGDERNVEELLAREWAGEAVPDDEVSARRWLNQIKREHQRRVHDPAALTAMHAQMAAFEVGQQAMADGREALERGELGVASVELRVAAGLDVGDAVVRLAEVLDRLGEYEAAQAWRAVAIADGHIADDDMASQPGPARRSPVLSTVPWCRAVDRGCRCEGA